MEIDDKVNEKSDQDLVEDQKAVNVAKADEPIVRNQSELVQMLTNYWLKVYNNALLRKIISRALYIAMVIFIFLFIF